MGSNTLPFVGESMGVRDFALAVLRRLGAAVEPSPSGVRVELDRAQLHLLEGRPSWLSGPYASLEDHRAALYLAFDTRQADADPQAELVAPGSFRLDQLIAAALRTGRLGRAWLRPPGVRPQLFRPYLFFHFMLTYVGHEPREGLASVAVDLVSGDAFPWRAAPDRWRLASTGNGTPTETARLSVGEAHQRAVEALARALAPAERAWFAAAREWLERELDNLYTYWRAALADESGSDVEAAPRARLEELQAMARPHVRARAEAATLLYMPLVRRGPRDGPLYNPVLGRPV